jgi:hypothetical protein
MTSILTFQDVRHCAISLVTDEDQSCFSKLPGYHLPEFRFRYHVYCHTLFSYRIGMQSSQMLCMRLESRCDGAFAFSGHVRLIRSAERPARYLMKSPDAARSNSLQRSLSLVDRERSDANLRAFPLLSSGAVVPSKAGFSVHSKQPHVWSAWRELILRSCRDP